MLDEKEFLSDSAWRLGEMQKRTRGTNPYKNKYTSQAEFVAKFGVNGLIKLDGYQIIGNLAFVPTGTWANALRARTIIEKDFMEGRIKEEPKFILLQYGGTLQVCSYKKMEEMDDLPKLRSGEV